MICYRCTVVEMIAVVLVVDDMNCLCCFVALLKWLTIVKIGGPVTCEDTLVACDSLH